MTPKAPYPGPWSRRSFFGRGRLPAWFSEFTQYTGIAIVSAIVALSGDPATPFALFYLWLAVQSTFAVPWRRAIFQGLWLALSYGVALATVADGGFPFVRWLMMVSTAIVMAGLVAYMRERVNTLVDQLNVAADTDVLTGLRNRRALLADLDAALEQATIDHPRTLIFYDLDGFKAYNDIYGHPAGDALLRRLGHALGEAVQPLGHAYRLGGDEFCILAEVGADDAEPVIAAAHGALREQGEGFEIGATSGFATLPLEADTASEALRTADRRMYAAKGVRAEVPARQARDLLLRVLEAREPALHAHHQGVGRKVAEMGRRLKLDPEELDIMVRAAELHDIGKVGIPDDILNKPDLLEGDELQLMQTHTMIGQRILGASPAMAPVAALVRSSHEHWDGGGYPDRLAGEEIPLGARIILICDAYEAMTETRAYGDVRTPESALKELRANAGTQFDPRLVQIFCELVASGGMTLSLARR